MEPPASGRESFTSPDPSAGWAFWWRWVLATNLGWFPGIALGLYLAEQVPESYPISRAVLAAAVAACLFGAAQALVLRTLLRKPVLWWLFTLLGWSVGIGLARLLIDASSVALSPLADTIGVAAIAGGVVGAPQALLLKRHCRGWAWWILISSLGWAILFPGALSGVGLVRLVRGRSASQ